MALFSSKERADLIVRVTACLMARWCYEHNGGVPLHCPCSQPCIKDVAEGMAATVVDEIGTKVEAGTL